MFLKKGLKCVFVSCLIIFACICLSVSEESLRLIEPAMRSSLWRFDNSLTPILGDHSLICEELQQNNVGRRASRQCEICGGHGNENGGIVDSGRIARRYKVGDKVTMIVDVLSSTGGDIELKLCKERHLLSQECFDEQPLTILNGVSNGKFFRVEKRKDHDYGLYKLEVKLPPGLVCMNCVLQMTYKSKTGVSQNSNSLGCNNCRSQIVINNCADVTIGVTGNEETAIGQPDDLVQGPLASRIKIYQKSTHVSSIVVNKNPSSEQTTSSPTAARSDLILAANEHFSVNDPTSVFATLVSGYDGEGLFGSDDGLFGDNEDFGALGLLVGAQTGNWGNGAPPYNPNLGGHRQQQNHNANWNQNRNTNGNKRRRIGSASVESSDSDRDNYYNRNFNMNLINNNRDATSKQQNAESQESGNNSGENLRTRLNRIVDIINNYNNNNPTTTTTTTTTPTTTMGTRSRLNRIADIISDYNKNNPTTATPTTTTTTPTTTTTTTTTTTPTTTTTTPTTTTSTTTPTTTTTTPTTTTPTTTTTTTTTTPITYQGGNNPLESPAATIPTTQKPTTTTTEEVFDKPIVQQFFFRNTPALDPWTHDFGLGLHSYHLMNQLANQAPQYNYPQTLPLISPANQIPQNQVQNVQLPTNQAQPNSQQSGLQSPTAAYSNLMSWLPTDPAVGKPDTGSASPIFNSLAANRYMSSFTNYVSSRPTVICNSPDLLKCVGTPSNKQVNPNADIECTTNCRGGQNCSPQDCACTCQKRLVCVDTAHLNTAGTQAWTNVATNEDIWCTNECNSGNCPNNLCTCKTP